MPIKIAVQERRIEFSIGEIARATEDDEIEGCAGRELRHEGDPTTCIAWYGGTCPYCGIVG